MHEEPSGVGHNGPRRRSAAKAIGALLWLAACTSQPAPPQPLRDRVEAVAAVKGPPDAAQWCDRFFTPEEAPPLALPPTVALHPDGRVLPAAPGRWVWLNLWATWCKPCLRELPWLFTFGAQLRREGLEMDNWFVSIDDDAAAVRRFLQQHPDYASPHMTLLQESAALDGWTQRWGLQAGTSIPISALISPAGKLRCLRAGSIGEGDYAVVRHVVQQLQQT